MQRGVLTCADLGFDIIERVIARYHLQLVRVADGAPIAGSFWGDSEAGLVGDQLLARADTPVHSILHEASHFICMDPEHRQALHTDAGGGYLEESAVCFLQILLAQHLPGVGSERMMADMDAWGYSFRLGSTRAWFQEDADDARDWLQARDLIDHLGALTWKRNGDHSLL